MPKTRQRLLGALFGQSNRTWYAAELAQELNLLRSGVQRDLKSLTAAGLLQTRRKGRMIFYQANSDAPVFPELRGLILKTIGLVDLLREQLAPFADRIVMAFVYGSVAASRESTDSDVDLMVVGDVDRKSLSLPLEQASLSLGRVVNLTLYREDEFRAKRRQHFLAAVLKEPKLFVIGTDRELERLAQ